MAFSTEKNPAMVHGGNILATARKLGRSVDQLIDMSSNLSPFGMADGLRQVLTDRLDEIGYLPESGSETLCGLFADKYSIKPGMVLAGNGTTEFIYGVPATAGLHRAVIIQPTYGDYEPACQWADVRYEHFVLRAENNFTLDLQELGRVLRGGDIVFLCNPNNPTGAMVKSSLLHEFVKGHPKTLFLVDESYLPFVREPSLFEFPMPDNLFVLISFSKIYGIPGLRLGFLVAEEKRLASLAVRRKPWGVNRIAQVAGEFLISHGDSYVDRVVRYMEEERPRFVAGLKTLPGIEVVPGAANFILCRLTGDLRAGRLADEMLARNIMIRNCASFNSLDDRYFRLSLKSRESNAKCLSVLRQILK